MSNKDFVNEIRARVNGQQARIVGRRTKRMTKRGLGLIAVISCSVMICSAAILLQFGSLMQSISTENSVLLDNLGDGSTQILAPISGAHGGDIIKSSHTLKSLSSSYLSVDVVKTIKEGDDLIADDEITSDLYVVTGAEGQMDYGTVPNKMTRIANFVDYSWAMDFTGAMASSITLILAVDDMNSLKVTYATSAWHYCTWNQGSGTWGNLLELTEGVRDTDSGIMVSAPDGNHKKISLLYANAPEVFSWGWISTNNVPSTLTVPSNWGGSGDLVNMVQDGVQFSVISWPYLLAPHETLSFTERTELKPLITESDYSVQFDFIPTAQP
ncbi:MAG: hypothetical protein IMZ43_06525 [Thermoplasmata archaeon]|nr:hypothetical protein [Thermoplasmata archaeon]